MRAGGCRKPLRTTIRRANPPARRLPARTRNIRRRRCADALFAGALLPATGSQPTQAQRRYASRRAGTQTTPTEPVFGVARPIERRTRG